MARRNSGTNNIFLNGTQDHVTRWREAGHTGRGIIMSQSQSKQHRRERVCPAPKTPCIISSTPNPSSHSLSSPPGMANPKTPKLLAWPAFPFPVHVIIPSNSILSPRNTPPPNSKSPCFPPLPFILPLSFYDEKGRHFMTFSLLKPRASPGHSPIAILWQKGRSFYDRFPSIQKIPAPHRATSHRQFMT